MVESRFVEDTIAILRGLKERYEVHHQVRISDPAVIAAATLSHRYISDRFLPDKAIDLIDEASSRLRIEIDSVPVEIDEVKRRIMQLEIERTSLESDTDDASVDRREALEREIAELNEQLSEMTVTWQAEKDAIAHVGEIRDALDRAKHEADVAEREADLQRAAELRYGRIPELERELAEAEERTDGNADFLQEEVTPRTSPRSSPSGRASPSAASWRARSRSSSTWRSACTSGSSARTRRSRPSPTRCAVRAPGCRIPIARSARSSSSARPASARPSWARWRSSCSTRRRR